MSVTLVNPVVEAFKRAFWIAFFVFFVAVCALVLLAYCVVVIAVCVVPGLTGVWALSLIGVLLHNYFGYASVAMYALALLIVALRLLSVEVKNEWVKLWNEPKTEPYFWLD